MLKIPTLYVAGNTFNTHVRTLGQGLRHSALGFVLWPVGIGAIREAMTMINGRNVSSGAYGASEEAQVIADRVPLNVPSASAIGETRQLWCHRLLCLP